MTRSAWLKTLSRIRRRFASVRSKHALRRRGVDAEGVRLFGKPWIENAGRLVIGRRTTLCSRPVPLQLVTGTHGTLRVGDDVSIGHGSSIVAQGRVTIGDGARIGPFAILFDGEAADAVASRRYTARPIAIGRDVRIGGKVIVLPGASVGDGAEIAAGSVVSGVIPCGAVASGFPARVNDDRDEQDRCELAQRVARVLAGVVAWNTAPSAADEGLSGWDAAESLRLVTALEEEFRTTIPDREWLAVESIADLLAVIERRIRSDGGEDERPPPPVSVLH